MKHTFAISILLCLFSVAYGTKAAHEGQTVPMTSGVGRGRNSRSDFSFNVVQFVRKDSEPNGTSVNNFKKLTSLSRGEYQTVAGLEGIQSYVSAGTE